MSSAASETALSTRAVVTLNASHAIAIVRQALKEQGFGHKHQGFPVLDGEGLLLGVVTRSDIYEADTSRERIGQLIKRACVVTFDDCSLREAADTMAREHIGRLPVVSRAEPRRLLGIITRSDLVDAHATRLAAQGR
ncbi:MAG: CBS domain-containing protein [Myxococcales bacterium]